MRINVGWTFLGGSGVIAQAWAIVEGLLGKEA
jgi:hypothetical protein